MSSRLDRFLAGIEYLTDTGAIIAMTVAMLVVSADVFFRYGLNAPFPWSLDLLVLYVLPALFFLGLPGSYAKGAHVSVDIICNYIGARPRLVLHVIARIVAVGVFFALFYYGLERFLDAFRSGEVLPSPVVNWLIWPSTLLVPIGAGLAMLRAAERLVVETVTLFRGEDEVAALLALEPKQEGLAE